MTKKTTYCDLKRLEKVFGPIKPRSERQKILAGRDQQRSTFPIELTAEESVNFLKKLRNL